MIERPDLLAGPLRIGSASVTGEIAADLAAVSIRQARAGRPGHDRRACRPSSAWRAPGLSLRAEVQAQNVAARDLELYWPLAAGREAREWVTAEHHRRPRLGGGGDASRSSLATSTSSRCRSRSSAGRFAFDDLTLRYFETMPPLTGVAGSATFTGRRMDFDGRAAGGSARSRSTMAAS